MRSKKSQVVSKPIKSKPKPALEDLKQLLRDNLADLRREYLDTLVEFEEVPTLPKFISLERKLREITGIKVDLVSIRALKGEIGERIHREKVAL
jgi:predicted nucleotidyltransferase